MSVENKKVCRFELLMDAGFGAQKAGDILISAFAPRVLNPTVHAVLSHSSSCAVKAEVSICYADPHAPPNELEDIKEPELVQISVADSIQVGVHESRPVPIVLVPLLS